jgi:hypothetical protein
VIIATQETEVGGQKRKVTKTLSPTTKPMVLHACGPSYAETIRRKIMVQGWLWQNARNYLKNNQTKKKKKKKELGT